jgi:hypothetical protein
VALPRIYADFHKCDDNGRLVLTCRGTAEDIAKQGLVLRDHLQVTFYMDDANDDGVPDDLENDGAVLFDAARNRWVGVIDWDRFRHASDRTSSPDR